MSSAGGTIQKPMIEHVRDIQKHLTWIMLCIAACSGAAYAIHDHLLNLLQKPLGQTLYYTSPTGGFAFLFKLCMVAGMILALPAILYNVFRFLEPILEQRQRKGIYKYVLWSFILAYAGIAFAYFISLPSALHFLTNVTDNSIQSLINVNDYFNFALAYVAGYAVLFQLPLIILFMNRVKPMRPKKMMGAQRYVILGSFIVAAILTPTPDPFNQLMMAAPIILLYQVSVFLVVIINRTRRKAKAVIPVVEAQVQPIAEAVPVRVQPLKPAMRTTIISDIARPVRRQPVVKRADILMPQRPRVILQNPRMMVGNDFF